MIPHQIKQDELGRACGMYAGEGDVQDTNICWENTNEGQRLEGLRIMDEYY